jgi:hypothetical protein
MPKKTKTLGAEELDSGADVSEYCDYEHASRSELATKCDDSKKLKELEQIGFKATGEWRMDGESLVFNKCRGFKNAQHALYAFVIAGTVRYVGKTANTLETRMSQYAKPGPSQLTNIKVHGHIVDELKNGQQVVVYTRVGEDEQYIGSFQLNVAAGLEDSIIKELQPAWNVAGK